MPALTAQARRIQEEHGLYRSPWLLIHEVNTNREAPALPVSREAEQNLLGHGGMWRAGQRFTDAARGITIVVEAETEAGFVVTISVG